MSGEGCEIVSENIIFEDQDMDEGPFTSMCKLKHSFPCSISPPHTYLLLLLFNSAMLKIVQDQDFLPTR